MRTINWRHFAHAKCEACYHPEKVKVGVLCSEHQARAQGYVYGFEAAAKLAVWVDCVSLDDDEGNLKANWIAFAPEERVLVPGPEWHRRPDHAVTFGTIGDARKAALGVPWWPLQPWEVEA